MILNINYFYLILVKTFIMSHDDNIQTIDSFINKFPDYKKSFEESKKDLENYNLSNQNDFIGLYSILNIGMGCCVYIRYDISGKSFLGYFVHNDCYGQYGESTNDFKKAKDFVSGYMCIDLAKH